MTMPRWSQPIDMPPPDAGPGGPVPPPLVLLLLVVGTIVLGCLLHVKHERSAARAASAPEAPHAQPVHVEALSPR